MVSAAIHACLGRVRLEALGQLLRAAEGRGVPAVDLVGSDPQALSRHAADERGGEQAVVAAEQHPRGDVGPRRKRRWLPHPRLGLPPAPLQRLRRELRRNVLVEQGDVVLVPLLPLLPVPRVRPVFGRRLSRRGDHRRDQDQELHRHPIAPTTASVYSASPAASSSHGRSGTTVSWPRSRRSASTRCQYQPTSPAPWIRTNVLIPRPPCVLQSPFRTPWPVWNDAVEAMDSSVRPRKRSMCWSSSPTSRSTTTRLHDPGARVEPDAVSASVRCERLSVAGGFVAFAHGRGTDRARHACWSFWYPSRRSFA